MKSTIFVFLAVLIGPIHAHSADDTDNGWPRIVTNGEQITIYQPEVESWKDNQLSERAAVSVQRPSSANPIYGVIWITARTEVDKANRVVTLEDIKITKANFPSDTSHTDEYLKVLRAQSSKLVRTIGMDRLQANLAITQAEEKRSAPKLDNTPPRVIYSNKPAVLVLVDGDPVLRDTSVSNLKRVINTRALITLNNATGKYNLYLGDRWMESQSIDGPWTSATNTDSTLDDLKKSMVDQKDVDLFNDPQSPVMQDLKSGIVPQVFVATRPTELLQSDGAVKLQSISGTSLLYVSNSPDNIFVDSSSNNYFVLLSGRWFKSSSLNGPWSFVSAKKLPADFAKIPNTHRKSDVLASVANTPQAEEAAVANEIPQTATVDRQEAKLSVNYDGKPELRPIAGTPLKYVVNSRTPVIEVDSHSYYSVENGIWFAATSPQGPWVVATQVPAVIYTIPPSSPLYYVTFVKVYGSNPRYVYVGYTPGYLGSYYSDDGVVVYGSGYAFSPWIGTYWVGYPWTFGFGFAWGPAFVWGFGAPFYYPWWGPWWGWNRFAWWRPYGPSRVIAINHYNVYRGWSQPVIRNTWDRAAAANRANFVRSNQPNNVFSTRNGNIYRYNGKNWEQRTGQTWTPSHTQSSPQVQNRTAPPRGAQMMDRGNTNQMNELEQSRQSRSVGDQRWNSFRSSGGHPSSNPPSTTTYPTTGGFHSGSAPSSSGGGFHGGSAPSSGGSHGGGGGGGHGGGGGGHH